MAPNRNDILRDEPVYRKKDWSPFHIGVLVKEVGSFSDTRKLEVIEKVWSPRRDPFVFSRTIEGAGLKSLIKVGFSDFLG